MILLPVVVSGYCPNKSGTCCLFLTGKEYFDLLQKNYTLFKTLLYKQEQQMVNFINISAYLNTLTTKIKKFTNSLVI